MKEAAGVPIAVLMRFIAGLVGERLAQDGVSHSPREGLAAC